MGFNESEIASALKIDQSNVSRHVAAARRGGSWMSRTARERYGDLLQQTYDSVMLSMKEAWRLYLSPEIKPELKHVFLAKVQAGIGLLGHLLPDAEALMFEEALAKSNESQQKVEQMMAEWKQRNKVLPVRTGT